MPLYLNELAPWERKRKKIVTATIFGEKREKVN